MCKGHLFRIEEKGELVQKKDGSLTNKAYIVHSSEELIKEIKKNASFWINHRVSSIPCGVCKECRLKDSQQWAFRCMKESKYHKSNYMITLTYDDNHIPKNIKINEKTGEIDQISYTLRKEDHQKFLKSLRKAYSDQSLKFKLCGEYGSDNIYTDRLGRERKGTKRPHFHIIVFGLDIDDLKFHKWSKCEWSKEKNALYKSKKIDKLWKKGWVDINEVNYETCAYVSRYIMKKQKGAKGKEYYEEENKEPEYQECSKGIGEKYFYDNIEKFLKDEDHFIKTKKGIKSVSGIRYFDKIIEREYPEEWEKIKKERRKRSEAIMADILRQTNISETEYIDNKARKTEKRTKNLIRPLD